MRELSEQGGTGVAGKIHSLKVRSPLLPSAAGSPALRENAPTQIVEAQGWVINSKGEVVLTATPQNVTPHNPWMTPANCHTPQNSS